ncbi:MAG: hypothetical protein WDM76_11135 [Limisphaerales bacterium]
MNRIRFLSLIGFLIITPLRCTFCAEAGHDFDKWEKEIAAFEARIAPIRRQKNALLFVGSSTIRLWETLAKDFPGQTIIIAVLAARKLWIRLILPRRLFFPMRHG